ncbi:MAG: ribonuclease P protein component [Candidatus Doudnabacteria bacterium]|nr:ribonuclease P protein component [Candidatus Doudnabacteria bacterium]
MLKKVNRLAKAKDIFATLGRGRTFFNPYFSVKFLRRSGASRFTVVVSTKVYKSAVKRNRLKRVAREFLRRRLTELPAGDYLISAKPKIRGLPENQRLGWFSDLISKIR